MSYERWVHFPVLQVRIYLTNGDRQANNSRLFVCVYRGT
jgi:hypothetical protein